MQEGIKDAIAGRYAAGGKAQSLGALKKEGMDNCCSIGTVGHSPARDMEADDAACVDET